jgi:hypothetical protein
VKIIRAQHLVGYEVSDPAFQGWTVKKLLQEAGLEEPSQGVLDETGSQSVDEVLARYALSQDQLGQIRQFSEGRDVSVEVVDAVVPISLNIYADSYLGIVTERMVNQDPIEGVDFNVQSDLRTRPRTPEAFEGPGLVLADSNLEPYAWMTQGSSSVRVETLSAVELASLKPTALVALTFNPRITIDHVFNQQYLVITVETLEGTKHLIFA